MISLYVGICSSKLQHWEGCDNDCFIHEQLAAIQLGLAWTLEF